MRYRFGMGERFSAMGRPLLLGPTPAKHRKALDRGVG